MIDLDVEVIQVNAFHIPVNGGVDLIESPIKAPLFLSVDDTIGYNSFLIFDDSTPWKPGSSRVCELQVWKTFKLTTKWQKGKPAYLGPPGARRISLEQI